MFYLKFNPAVFGVGIAWCIFWIIVAIDGIGDVSCTNILMTWVDAMWVFGIAGVLPFCLGIFSFVNYSPKDGE